jgi:DNA helicase II / ATP-dependent DNA helicase PcrA
MSKDLQTLIQKLNDQQRQAVQTIEGPVLVIAGPGTGKTQMLALRIANILNETDARPANILCLTFTDSGVTAMRQRLMSIIGSDAYYVKIHTFHSFCNEVIQGFPEKFSFTKSLNQLDDLSKFKIIRDVIESLDSQKKYALRPLHDLFYYQNDILNAIQTLKREGIRVDTLRSVVMGEIKTLEDNPDVNKKTGKPKASWTTKLKSLQKNLEVAEIYQKYNEQLLEKGFYDYEDMILFVIEKLSEDEELLAHYQEQFLYILVDEYQDTNGAQNELLRNLGSFDKSPNIFAVGDDDQAIYRFQGANVENLLFFANEYEDVQTIPVTTNYRSSQLILNLAGSLIVNNKARLVNIVKNLSKILVSGTSTPNIKAELHTFETSENENEFIIKKIKELTSQGIDYSDIAVFYRKHSDAEAIVSALIKSEIPLRLAVGKNTLDETIVAQFLNLLKVIHYTDVDRDFLLFQVLFYDFLKFSRLDVFKITKYASDKKISLFDLISSKQRMIEAGVTDSDYILDFSSKIVNWKAESANYSLIHFIERVAESSAFISHVFKDDYKLEEINAINSFFIYVQNLTRQNKKITLAEFLNDISLLEENKIRIEEKELDIQRNGVNLMTAHKSKGLEYQYVFITNFYDGNWGGRKKRDNIKLPLESILTKDLSKQVDIGTADLETEDERRLFYVALTRAREKIYITYAKKYPSGNTSKDVSPSQFIGELDQSLIDRYENTDSSTDDIQYIKTSLLPSKLASNYKEDEREYLRSLVESLRLSPTSLNQYIRCPLEFKFNTLLGVAQSTDRNRTLGSGIHSSLENFFRRTESGLFQNVEYLIESFEKYMQNSNLGGYDLDQVLVEGKALLTGYYNQYKDEFVQPAEVEYSFSGKDLYFESDGLEPIRITGKIDKLEWINKANNTVRVIDYKVKTPQSENQIMGLTKTSDGEIYRQLMFYKLLMDQDIKSNSKLFKTNYIPEEFQIDFIKPGNSGSYKKVNLRISDKDFEDFKFQLIDVVSHIRDLDFAGGSEYPLCGECQYCKV